MLGKTTSLSGSLQGQLPAEYLRKKSAIETTLQDLRTGLKEIDNQAGLSLAKMEELKRSIEVDRAREKMLGRVSIAVMGAGIAAAAALGLLVNPMLMIPPVVVGMFGKLPFDVRKQKLNDKIHLQEIDLHKLEFNRRWKNDSDGKKAEILKKIKDVEKELGRLDKTAMEAQEMLEALQPQEAGDIGDVEGRDDMIYIDNMKLQKNNPKSHQG